MAIFRQTNSAIEPPFIRVQDGEASGMVVAAAEPLSFWGGVDPATGTVIDIHHPLNGICLAGKILVIPTTRGSCSGSGVLLDLILSNQAPAAMVFASDEEVLTLGAIVAAEMFDKRLPILRASPEAFELISRSSSVAIQNDMVEADGSCIPVAEQEIGALQLDDDAQALLDGRKGLAVAQAMRILCTFAIAVGATEFVEIRRAHIDGCIYTSHANLTFAERMLALGASVGVPTTTNAISVDLRNWRRQGVSEAWGSFAARLAQCYVEMGCQPTFTCSPYLLQDRPRFGEMIGWAESNAVIYANSVIGARTNKHPDFLDLCIAITARAPLTGAYLTERRQPNVAIDVKLPQNSDASFWPIIGYLAGLLSPDQIPVLRGLAGHDPSQENLKALCAAFGTTSAAAMLHVEGVTPEAMHAIDSGIPSRCISAADLLAMWRRLNEGPVDVDLVAIGSPHASAEECREVANAFDGRARHPELGVIVTTGREVVTEIEEDGTADLLRASGVQVLPDLCWCSITVPVFPAAAQVIMTNSGKYAHYGPGLSGRTVRFGGLSDCLEAALTGKSPARGQLPDRIP